jgi:hypothetical protein
VPRTTQFMEVHALFRDVEALFFTTTPKEFKSSSLTPTPSSNVSGQLPQAKNKSRVPFSSVNRSTPIAVFRKKASGCEEKLRVSKAQEKSAAPSMSSENFKSFGNSAARRSQSGRPIITPSRNPTDLDINMQITQHQSLELLHGLANGHVVGLK